MQRKFSLAVSPLSQNRNFAENSLSSFLAYILATCKRAGKRSTYREKSASAHLWYRCRCFTNFVKIQLQYEFHFQVLYFCSIIVFGASICTGENITVLPENETSREKNWPLFAYQYFRAGSVRKCLFFILLSYRDCTVANSKQCSIEQMLKCVRTIIMKYFILPSFQIIKHLCSYN